MGSRRERRQRAAAAGAKAPWWRGPAVLLWLRFAAFLAVLMGLTIWARPFTDGRLTRWIASACGAVLRLTGTDATVTGAVVETPLGAMTIIRECTAVYPVAIFVAAVLAYPSTWLRRLAGIGLGVAALQLVNVVRLLSLLYVARHHPAHLDLIHLVVWQSLIVVAAVVLWLLWVGELATPRH